MTGKTIMAFLLFVATLSICGCGGGGHSVSTGASVTPGAVVINGTASLGLIRNGKVNVYQLDSQGNKKLIAQTTTDSNGKYSVSITTPTGPVMVEIAGGTYVDEATGTVITRADAEVMRACASSATSSVQVAVTPLTELAVQLAGSDLSATNIDAVNTKVSDAFNVDILTVQPVAPTVDGFKNTTPDQQAYSLALAAISQQVQDSPTKSIATVLSTYENNLSSDTGRITVQTATDFQNSLTTFLTSSSRNQTGVTVTPTALANFGSYKYPVKLQTSGIFAAGSFIKGLQVTLQLPPGVTVKADSAGVPEAGVVLPSGQAASVSTVQSFYDASTRIISLGIMNAQPGFGLGEFITVNCDVAPGAAINLSDFTVSQVTVSDTYGANISGIDVLVKL